MAFGRKWLAGILRNEDMSPEEKEKAIMDEHIAVTDGLKDERDKFKDEAEKVPALTKQLEAKDGGIDYKKKYEEEHQAFEDFKKQAASDAELFAIRAACRKILIEEGISDKRADGIVKVMEARGDLAKMKRDKDGNLEGADDLRKSIGEEWADWKATTSQAGAKVENPPKVGKAGMTKEEIMAIEDTAERQKAMYDHKELFGIK